MAKEYIKNTVNRAAKPRSKRLLMTGGWGSAVTSTSGLTGFATSDALKMLSDLLQSMWYFDEEGNLCTEKTVIIDNNLIVTKDTSSRGEGEDTPSAGLDEEQLQAYLDEHKYVTEDDIAGLIPDVDLSGYYTSEQTDSAISTAIANLINGAPTTLDTLKEISDALAENEDVVDALEEAIGKKADASALTTLASRVSTAETNITNLTNNKANKATTLAGYGITNAYTKTEIDTKVTTINNSISGVSGRVTTLETWKSDISKYITIVDGNVKIGTNLIVTGDTSSGGESGETGTAIGSMLTKWTDYNASTMSGYVLAASLGYDLHTRVNSLEANGALSFTTTGSGNAVTSISKSGTTVTVTKGTSFLPLAGGTIDGTLTIKRSASAIRYTSADGTLFGWLGFDAKNSPVMYQSDGVTKRTLIHSGNIKDYNAGGLASVSLTNVSVNDYLSANRDAKLYYGHGSANVTDDAYEVGNSFGMLVLPLASTMTTQLMWYWDNIFFRTYNPSNGWYDWKKIAFTTSTVAASLKLAGTYISSSDTETNPLIRLNVKDGTNFYLQAYDTKLYVGAGIASAVSITSGGTVGIQGNLRLANSRYIWLNDGAEGLYMNGASINWHNTSAYTNSLINFTATSITLVPPVTTKNTLKVGGALYMPNNTDISMASADGTTSYGVMYLSTSNTLVIGNDTAYYGYSTFISGNDVRIRYSTSRTVGIYLNSSGYVTIGSSDLTESKYKLYVNGHIYTPNNVYIGSATSFLQGNSTQLWASVSGVSQLVINADSVRRGTASSAASVTLGTSEYPWGGLYSTTGNFTGAVTIGELTLAQQAKVLKVTNEYGYAQIGPQNTSHCHIYTDLPTFYLNKGMVVVGQVRPSADAIYTLGASTHRWNEIHAKTGCIAELYGGTTSTFAWRLIKDTDSNGIWLQSKLVDNTSNSGKFYISGVSAANLESFTVYATTSYFKGNVLPQTSLGYNLGSSTVSWNKTYTRYIDTLSGYYLRFCVGGTEYMQLTDTAQLKTSTDIIPTADAIYTLGSSSFRWSTIYGGAGNYGVATNHVLLKPTNVCINTTTTGGWARRFSITQNEVQMISFGAFGTGATISYGYIGTDYEAPWVKLTSANTTFYGNVIVTGDTSSGSDIRFKDIIKDKTLKIEDIAKAPLFTFRWNDRDDDTIHLGSSAQYWEKVCPWIVTGEDFKSLNYAVGAMGGVISLARHDLQQDKEIKALKRKVNDLEKEIKRLKEE